MTAILQHSKHMLLLTGKPAWPFSVFAPRQIFGSYCQILTDLDKILQTPIVVRNTLVGPRAGSGVVRIDPLRFLAGCRTRRLN